MFKLPKRGWVLLLLVCLAALQWHVGSELNGCSWHLKPVPRNPARNSSNSTATPGCAVCLAGGWATLAALPAFGLEAVMTPVLIESPATIHEEQLYALRSPRAPPLA